MREATNYISIAYTNDILASAGLSAAELAETARMAVAAKLFSEAKLTLGQAAALCGFGRVEFMEKLHQHGYSVVNLQADDADDELRFVHG